MLGKVRMWLESLKFLKHDVMTWYTVAAGGKSSRDCVVRPGRKLHVAFIL